MSRSLTRLLRTLIFRPLRRDFLRSALTVLAVALGVAVVIAIDLAGDAAAGSFQSSLVTVLGKTDLEILANGGIDESWMAKLTALPINARFSPVIETQVELAKGVSATLYGVDLIGNPAGERAVEVSKDLANRLHLSKGSTLTIRGQSFQIAAIVPGEQSEFAVLDIDAAQYVLKSYGKLDRIDVFVSPREDFAKAESAIRKAIPSAYRLDKPGTRGEENQRMLRAFRWNLRVLSYISLVVGAFLIYNTISVSVVRRRPEIGILRALGAGRTAVQWLFLSEALMFGLIGSAIGIALGRFLAVGAVSLIADTVNSLYTSSSPAPIALTPLSIATAMLAGTLVAFFSALGPAREAMGVAPTEAMGRGVREHQARLNSRRDLLISGILALLALAASQFPAFGGRPIAGYAATLLAIGAAALLAPTMVLGVVAFLRPAARAWFGAEGLLAGRSLTASLGRTSVVVAALATAIAMMAAVGIMVGSFRETVLVWLDTQLKADLYIRPAGPVGAGLNPALPPNTAGIVAKVPGVEAVDVFHAFEFDYAGFNQAGQRATIGGGNMDIVRRFGRLRFLPGQDRDAILASLPDHDNVIVSEPFSNKHHIRAGDRISIALGGKQVPVTVKGVYYEYSSDRGYVIFDRSTLLRYLPNQPATNIAVYLKPGTDSAAARRAILDAAASLPIVVAPNELLRKQAIVIFDRTFAITYALEGVAVIVAMLGAANSLLALVLDRRRELGLLRYLGASPPQIRRMILVEAGFLGLFANLLGGALGFALSLLLIFVVNKQSFGWTIQFHPPVFLLVGALSLVWCVTIVAGLYPARVASRLNPIEVIHEE